LTNPINMLRKYINILVFVLLPLFVSAQEFTIKKTPEEIQYEKEIEKEKKYLTFQNHFFNAIQQKEKEDYNKAIEELEECKQIYPNDIGLNFEFAKNYFKLKDYENAIYFNNEILKIEPNNVYVLEHLKKIYRTQRDFESAIEIQNKIIAINPKKKQDLIRLFISNREKDKAKEVFLALEKSHQTIDNKAYYKRVLFRKKTTKQPKKTNTVSKTKVATTNPSESSIENLQQLFKKNKDYKTLKKLITEEEKQLKFDLLSNDCKKGLELFPAQPFLYLMYGKAENKLSKYNNAIEVLKAGLDFIIDDTNLEADFYKQIAKAYTSLGNTKEASKFIEKANKLSK